MRHGSNGNGNDHQMSDKERITGIAELLVLGAIAAVGLSEGGKDRGCEGGGCDESKEPEKSRGP